MLIYKQSKLVDIIFLTVATQEMSGSLSEKVEVIFFSRFAQLQNAL
jgi:hypothetical protein